MCGLEGFSAFRSIEKQRPDAGEFVIHAPTDIIAMAGEPCPLIGRVRLYSINRHTAGYPTFTLCRLSTGIRRTEIMRSTSLPARRAGFSMRPAASSGLHYENALAAISNDRCQRTQGSADTAHST